METGPRFGRCHHRTARKQHVGELRGQNQVCRTGDLRQQMQLGQRHHRPHPFGRLEIVEQDIAETVCKLFQRRTVGSLTADHEDDVVPFLKQPRCFDQDLDPLLAGDVARIERDLSLPQTPFAAERLGTGGIGGKTCVGPVADFDHAIASHALGNQFRAHLRADRRNLVAQPKQARFEPSRQPRCPTGVGQQSGGKGCLDLEILDVDPQSGSRQFRCQPGRKHAEQRRRNRDHHLRPRRRRTKGCPHARPKRGQREARQMRDPPCPGGIGRNVMRAPGDGYSFLTGRVPAASGKAGIGPPLRIIGFADHGFDAVPARGQSLGQTLRIGPDPDRFGRVVEPDEQDIGPLHRASQRLSRASWRDWRRTSARKRSAIVRPNLSAAHLR